MKYTKVNIEIKQSLLNLIKRYENKVLGLLT